MTTRDQILAGLETKLRGDGVDFELVHHRHTETARAEADAIGVAPDEVAKTIILCSDRGFIRALIPASERLDLSKVRAVFDRRREIRLATEAELAAAYPGFELGAVPPLGGPAGDCVVVDRRLADADTLIAEAGTHDDSLELATRDLIIDAGALIEDICEEDAR